VQYSSTAKKTNIVDTPYVSRTVLMNKFSKVLPGTHFLWVRMAAEGLTRRMRPLSIIMHAGNLVNLSIHPADF
jgi:hypothetical protein